MESFGYVAVNKAGKEIKGSIEAETEAKALAEIRNRGMMVVSLSKQSMLTKDINIDLGGAPKPRDLSVFCRQFVSMTRAGVTIIDALRMLGEQTENKKLQKAVVAVRVDVEKGEPLAEAFAKHPKVFPNLLVSMTQAGEASGSLDIAMERMAAHFEKAAKTKALIKKAMIYPVVLIIVAIAVMVVMLVVVIPSYTGMFNDLGTELPAVTKAMVAASDFLRAYWYLVALAVIGVIVALKLYSKTNSSSN